MPSRLRFQEGPIVQMKTFQMSSDLSKCFHILFPPPLLCFQCEGEFPKMAEEYLQAKLINYCDVYKAMMISLFTNKQVTFFYTFSTA